MNELIYLDIETGGFNKYRDAICSITLKYKEESRTWYIKPYGKRYNNGAFAVHGITTRELYEKGIEPKAVIYEIHAFIITLTKGNGMFVGHNLHFDLSFLEVFFEEHQDNLYRNITYHYLDSMISANYLRYVGKINPPSLKLVDLYTMWFNDGLEKKAHRSEFDVEMTQKVFERLLLIENDNGKRN